MQTFDPKGEDQTWEQERKPIDAVLVISSNEKNIEANKIVRNKITLFFSCSRRQVFIQRKCGNNRNRFFSS